MPTKKKKNDDAIAGEAGASTVGFERRLADLTVEELLATAPSPSRSRLFAHRFPVPPDEYEQLELAARSLDAGALALDAAVDAQRDVEITAAISEENPAEDGAAMLGAEAALAPSAVGGFEGIGQTAFRPPDCTLAVGPHHVMVAVNVDLVIYDKSGNTTGRWANFSLFNPVTPPGAQLFDPKVAYDHYSDRWIVVIAARRANPQGSWLMIAVSQTGDPNGGYWIWGTDAAVNGATPTNTWADYPMLGFDTQGIYISTNQFVFGGGFGTAKLRIFNKAELYSGGVGGGHAIRWWDFWNLRNPDNSPAFSIQPACHFQGIGGAPRVYLVNSLFPSGSSLTLWTLSNALGLWTGGAPVLTRDAVACRGYSLPPGAIQRDGGATRLATNDIRLLNAVYQAAGGVSRLWTAHTSAFSWPGDSEARSVVQWYEIDIPTKSVVQQGAFGAPGLHYFFPVIQTDIERNAHLTFSRSGADEYGQLRHTGRRVGAPLNSLEGSALVRAGESAYSGGRWGDYFGVGRDPSDRRTVWTYGEYAAAGNTWRTWVHAGRY